MWMVWTCCANGMVFAEMVERYIVNACLLGCLEYRRIDRFHGQAPTSLW